ncbi:MAG: DNA-3-methyladenine glycosylase family protein [Bacillota bacterium]
MKYTIEKKEHKLVIRNLKDFNPTHIFENGQCFRWYREDDGSYTTVAGGRIINVLKEGDIIIVDGTDEEDWKDFWHPYFDLDRDYGEIKRELSRDPILREAIQFGDGLRLLNQDPYETIISFIISANNQIQRIKNAVEMISSDLGEYITTYRGRSYYSFPHPQKLADKSTEYIREKYRVGFRGDRIREASRRIADGEFDTQCIFDTEHGDAVDLLRTLPGVGPKVSGCILLFAYDKSEAFPVDVWVKRVMEYFYFKRPAKKKELEESGEKIFGEYAGYAQQYLFYYARELGIGK